MREEISTTFSLDKNKGFDNARDSFDNAFIAKTKCCDNAGSTFDNVFIGRTQGFDNARTRPAFFRQRSIAHNGMKTYTKRDFDNAHTV